MTLRIYVASSWRNKEQPAVVSLLRGEGYEVYDFRNPPNTNAGFAWSEIDPNWQNWTMEEYVQALEHPRAIEGYESDMGGMRWCNVCVGVQPFGRSASNEIGWCAGAGKKTGILLDEGEPELMVKMFDSLWIKYSDMLKDLKEWNRQIIPDNSIMSLCTQCYRSKNHCTCTGGPFLSK